MRNRGGLLKRIRTKYDEKGLAGLCRSALRRVVSKGDIASIGDVEPASDPLSGVLDWLARSESFSIVQVGAYVGDTLNDPLYQFLHRELSPDNRRRHHGSSVILVEPVKQYYELLQKNYSDLSYVKFENVAIAESAGSRDFYRITVRPEDYDLPEWLSQLGSLRADRMTKLWDSHEKTKKLKEFYLAHRIVEKVNCITFQELVNRHELQAIDFLQIDTEGYDYEIIRTIDFAKLTPRVINYERTLLAESESLCRELLIKAGYLLIDWGDRRSDTIAIHVA